MAGWNKKHHRQREVDKEHDPEQWAVSHQADPILKISYFFRNVRIPHEHVLAELRAYAPLVCAGGYCIVMDTVLEDMPEHLISTDRPWGLGNNPKTAVYEYLKENNDFVIDKALEAKLLITVAPDGYLRRVGA